MSTEDTTRPNHGVRRLPATQANGRGNTPSCAAASGTRPWIRIHPFRAPNVEIIATSATHLAHDRPRNDPPPNICAAACANGALESWSVAAG